MSYSNTHEQPTCKLTPCPRMGRSPKVPRPQISRRLKSHCSDAKDGCKYTLLDHFTRNIGAEHGLASSPLKLVQLLLAAGTVLHYKEYDKDSPKSLLEKFQYFEGENNGKDDVTRELAILTKLEPKKAQENKDEVVCVPQRLLLLARNEGDEDASGEQEDGTD
jgi:hypothetical protein